MKMPNSLIDKQVRVLNGPIITGRIDPTSLQKVEVNYLSYEVGAIMNRYPKSNTVKHLVDMIEELRQDVIALRSHVTWLELGEDEVAL